MCEPMRKQKENQHLATWLDSRKGEALYDYCCPHLLINAAILSLVKDVLSQLYYFFAFLNVLAVISLS